MALEGVTGGKGIGVDIGGILGGVGDLATGIGIFIVIAIIVGSITYFIANKKAYNKNIHIWEEINGQTAPTSEDVAREITLPNTTTRAYYLKKSKIYTPRPSKQFGKGHYIYFIRNDGEWINVLPSNLNTDMKTVNLNFDHTDMRLSNASLKKLVENNYKKTNWIKEYAPYIAIGILIIMLGLTFFLLLNKASAVASTLNAGISSQNQLVTTFNEILDKLDRICTSSGVRTVG